MTIFEKMECLHHGLKGSYSIKNVLPVRCPKLNCSDLEVSNGADAMVEFENLIFGNLPTETKTPKLEALLEYCKMDTRAMVRIYQQLVQYIQG